MCVHDDALSTFLRSRTSHIVRLFVYLLLSCRRLTSHQCSFSGDNNTVVAQPIARSFSHWQVSVFIDDVVYEFH